MTLPTEQKTVASIEVAGLTKRFGDSHAVGPIDLKVHAGEFVSLLGPSGCGKTTTLRMIAGFEEASSGTIHIGQQDMAGVPVERRGIGMVFQSYALFPHLSVFNNVAFGLKLRRLDKDRIAESVAQALQMVGLSTYGSRMPKQLSGGQQQRVALARALAVQPAVLLLDEPLSNLDLKLREQMREEIRGLQQRLGITTLYVTHDQSEAMAMSDRVVVMNRGRIEQVGEPREVYEQPATKFVASFIGQCTILDGVAHPLSGSTLRFVANSGDAFEVQGRRRIEGAAGLVVRPEFIRILPHDASGAGADHVNAIAGDVLDVVYMGERLAITVQLAQGARIVVADRAFPGRALPRKGERVTITIAPEDLSLVPASKGTP